MEKVSKLIWEKFLTTVKKNNLICSQDRVLAAVSGGPDSVCMVHLLNKLQKIFLFGLGIAYINHKLRPEKIVRKEIELVKNLGEKLNIPVFITEINLHCNKSNIESKARKLRYRKLYSIAVKNNYNKIATAHTLNDNAETVLLNLIRSTKGEIVGIPLKRGVFNGSEKISIIRPMLEIEKVQIMNFLKTNKVKFCIDKTNRDLSYSRNFLRLKILPLLKKLNPAALRHLSNLAIAKYQKAVLKS